MGGFRRFVMGLVNALLLIVIAVVTIVGAVSGAAMSYLPWGLIRPSSGEAAQIIGIIVGGFAGFVLSAAPAVVIFALSEIAENTRQTLLEVRRVNNVAPSGGVRVATREPTL